MVSVVIASMMTCSSVFDEPKEHNIMGHLSFPRNVFINGPTTFTLLENQSFSRPKKTIIEDKYENTND